MTTKGATLTYHTRLRATPEERAILERVQESLAAVGVAASLNDVLRHLIRAAEIPIPADAVEARDALLAHQADCAPCKSSKTPRCPDGIFIRREFQRHLGVRDGRRYVLQPVTSPDMLAS